MRLLAVLILALAVSWPLGASADGTREATVYRNPACGCCEGWADYLARRGFDVELVNSADMGAVKERLGVPGALASCHTAVIDGYVVEGHVPLATIARLLEEKPDLAGISLPGMPTGSPGMNGPKTEPFVIYGFGDGAPEAYDIR